MGGGEVVFKYNYIILKEGYPFIIITAVITLLTGYLAGPVFAVLPFVLMVYFMYFFRQRVLDVKQDPSLLYSPADGTVMGVEEFYDTEFLNEPAKKVTIFLSVFNVHSNRSPMTGLIKYMRYTCGGYEPAYKDSAPIVNERMAIGLDNGNNRVLVIQIAGILARRIVSWTSLGSRLRQGEPYGMIKFGSCTELVMPRSVEVLVRKGDKVQGGISIIGRQKAE
ncbi:phosphatidylserine decarboxylase [Acidaminococcus timonensis]|uniref:phosphatidylserine decarboxylase n=1 Tax=Acidaminococcus timonensis TaxID=1871002 RepID=UPI00374CC056